MRLSVEKRQAVANLVNELERKYDERRVNPKPGQHARVDGHDHKIVQWYTTRTLIARMGPHPRPNFLLFLKCLRRDVFSRFRVRAPHG